MEHLDGEERVRERGLLSLEKRQLLGDATAVLRTCRGASKEMEPGPSQCHVAGKLEVATLN